MTTDPFAYEREEERDAERFYTGPDDPDRPDPNEYEDSGLYLSKRLDCGHMVEASEDSGGMDELDRVTVADVQRLLDFKIATHKCEPIPLAVAEHGIRTTITDLVDPPGPEVMDTSYDGRPGFSEPESDDLYFPPSTLGGGPNYAETDGKTYA